MSRTVWSRATRIDDERRIWKCDAITEVKDMGYEVCTGKKNEAGSLVRR